MWQKHLIFPKAPRGFWRRFQGRWGKPLRLLEEIISLSESLGADSTSPRFEAMDETYWAVLRSLHSRTCLHARSVLALLSNGLVDPAWAQWRICHESSSIATYIATTPEMASRYMRYSLVNKYHLARELITTGHEEAPPKSEFDELKRLADKVLEELRVVYGHQIKAQNHYGWSGLGSFKAIETKVFQGQEWNPRGEFILASERVHSAPNAGEPLEVGDKHFVFVVGPKDSGLTGPADLTALSIGAATHALILKASNTTEDEEKLKELGVKCRVVGAMCWVVDPEILCHNCGGCRPGAQPPDLIPIDERPEPCSCQ